MKAGGFDRATSTLNALLADEPRHVEALYCLAVCQRKLDDIKAADASLDILMGAAPRYGHAHQERGFLRLDEGRTEEAIAAFNSAVTLNPALHGSWRALASLPGHPRHSEAQQQAQWLASLPPQLVSAASFIHQGELQKAERLCRQFLKAEPRHPEAMRLLAELGSRFQILDDAEFLLESCLTYHPDYIRARLDYVAVLHRRQKFDKALEQAGRLVETDPENPSFLAALANAQQACGDFETAIQTYGAVLQRDPTSHTVQLAQGHALKTMGRTPEAIDAYRKAYAIKPGFGDAFWSLANLKTYRFTADEMAALNHLANDQESAEDDRIHACFALGKALEDDAAYAEAFGCYARGNALRRAQGRFRHKAYLAELDHQKTHFDADFFAQRAGQGHPAPDPIFILGLPRAGSTLLEQILASHSQVDGTMELANMVGLAHRLGGRGPSGETARYPAILADLGNDDLATMGRTYITDTQGHRQGAPFFIDKMPNNFRHIALIHLILPNATIVDARREPMACCFSAYKQFFAEGQEFSYDLDDLGLYYREYEAIMDHWDRVFPGRILRVQHEDVIDDLDGQVRRLLDHCGLPFEQACVDFHANPRAVRTPSSEQVRQPIYATGRDQWRNFEPFLDPLKHALKPA